MGLWNWWRRQFSNLTTAQIAGLSSIQIGGISIDGAKDLTTAQIGDRNGISPGRQARESAG